MKIEKLKTILQRKVKRNEDKIQIEKINEETLNKYGFWDLGYFTGRKTAFGEVLDELDDSLFSEENVIDLVRIIQRLEREGADLSIKEIKLILDIKTKLGYSIPISSEDGTGSLI